MRSPDLTAAAMVTAEQDRDACAAPILRDTLIPPPDQDEEQPEPAGS